MGKILKVLVYLSLLINLYYYLLWTYIYNSYEQHEDRIDHFGYYFPLLPPTNNLWFLVLTTFLSILVVGLKDILQPNLRIIFVILQAMAFLLYLWQLM